MHLVRAISKKSDGSMKLTGDGARDKDALENRKKFFLSLNIDPSRVVGTQPVHGNNVRVVADQDAGIIISSADGLITSEKDLFLAITIADCLPIYMYDPVKKIVGLVHAGWRGLVKNISENAIKKLKNVLGSNPKDILVGIGPAIGPCHFEVQDDVIQAFQQLPPDILVRRNGGQFLNLKEIAKQQLVDAGVSPAHIEVSPLCTYCSSEYFSFRRDRPQKVETMIAVIGLQ